MLECILVLTAAFFLDWAMGDPVYRLHPVRLMGNAISGLERFIFSRGQDGYLGGVVLLLGVLLLVNVLFLVLLYLVGFLPPLDLLLFIYLVFSCLGLRDLASHASPVAIALNQDNLSQARGLLQKIVGRDVSRLDSPGTIRAAVESVAENFVDGFLALVFWFVVGSLLGHLLGVAPVIMGVSLALSYRAVNTLDSMVGYKSFRYERFGYVSAKLDDILNYVPARASILVISLAARFCGKDWRRSLHVGFRDRWKHSSPNAGHAEAAVAGALGVRLGGPVQYSHALVDKPWMGDEIRSLDPGQIWHSTRLVMCASWISWGLGVLFLLLL